MKSKQTLVRIFGLLFLSMMASCSLFLEVKDNISLDQTVYQIKIGEQIQLTAKNTDNPNRGIADPKWDMEDTTVASIYASKASALVTGEAVGKSRVRLKSSNGGMAEAIVTVVPNPATATQTLKLSKLLISLKVGESFDLTATSKDSSTPMTWAINDVGTNGGNKLFDFVSNNDQATILGKTAGQGSVTVTQGVQTVTAKVIVYEDSTNATIGTAYLYSQYSTYSLIQAKETTLSVALFGLDVAEEQNILWRETDKYKVDNGGKSILTLFGQGKSIFVTGAFIGITEIEVSHPKILTPIKLLVRVQDSGTNLTMEMSETGVVMNQGDQHTISAKVLAGTQLIKDYDKQIQWTVSDGVVLTVLGSGPSVTLYAKTSGQVEITATLSTNVSAKAQVLVTGAGGQQVYISAISNLTINIGETKTIAASLQGVLNNPSDPSGMVWVIGDSTVATFFGNGTSGSVTGLKVGITNIAISHPSYPTVKYNIALRVNDPANSPANASGKDISLDKTNYVMIPGQQLPISASIVGGTPSDYKAVVWSLSSPTGMNVGTLLGGADNVAFIANSVGTARITATFGAQVAECDVLIQTTLPVDTGGTAVKYITSPASTKTVDIGGQITLSASVVNGTATDNNALVWTSSDANILNVFGGGGSVVATGLATGQVIVTVTSAANGISYKIYVSVIGSSKTVSISPNANICKPGDQIPLTASIPGGTDNDYTSIVWTTNQGTNQNVLILGYGKTVLVQILNVGSVTVTATIPNGNFSKSDFIITSTGGVGTGLNGQVNLYIETAKYKYDMTPGQLVSASATIVGGTADQIHGLTWSVDNPSALDIYGTGGNIQFYGKAAGEAIVTVSSPSAQPIKIYVSVANPNVAITPSTLLATMAIADMQSVSVNTSGLTASQISSLNWVSSNPNVAKVVFNGPQASITAVGNGQATITISATGATTGSIVVNVETAASAGNITLSVSSNNDTIVTGNEKLYTAQLNGGSQADQNSIVWKVVSGGNAVLLTGSGSTMRIAGVAPGTAQVNISTPNYPGLLQTLWIKVNPVDYSLSLPNSIIQMQPSSQYSITAIGTNLTQVMQNNVQWSLTSNNAGATIVGNGMSAILTSGASTGLCTVNATITLSGGQTLLATATVTINNPITSGTQSYFTTTSSLLNMNIGDQQSFNVSYINEPSSGYGNVVWSVVKVNATDPDVIQVIGNQLQSSITAVNAGNAYIQIADKRANYTNPIQILVNVRSVNRSLAVSPTVTSLTVGSTYTFNFNIQGGVTSDYKNIMVDYVTRDATGAVTGTSSAVTTSQRLTDNSVTVIANAQTTNTWLRAYFNGYSNNAVYAQINVSPSNYIGARTTSLNLQRFGDASVTTAQILLDYYPTTMIISASSDNPAVASASATLTSIGGISQYVVNVSAVGAGSTTINITNTSLGLATTVPVLVTESTSLAWSSTADGAASDVAPGNILTNYFNVTPFDMILSGQQITDLGAGASVFTQETSPDSTGMSKYSVHYQPGKEGTFYPKIRNSANAGMYIQKTINSTISSSSFPYYYEASVNKDITGASIYAQGLSSSDQLLLTNGTIDDTTTKLYIANNTSAKLTPSVKASGIGIINPNYSITTSVVSDVGSQLTYSVDSADDSVTFIYTGPDTTAKIGDIKVSYTHGYNLSQTDTKTWPIYVKYCSIGVTGVTSSIGSPTVTDWGSASIYQKLTPGSVVNFSVSVQPASVITINAPVSSNPGVASMTAFTRTVSGTVATYTGQITINSAALEGQLASFNFNILPSSLNLQLPPLTVGAYYGDIVFSPGAGFLTKDPNVGYYKLDWNGGPNAIVTKAAQYSINKTDGTPNTFANVLWAVDLVANENSSYNQMAVMGVSNGAVIATGPPHLVYGNITAENYYWLKGSVTVTNTTRSQTIWALIDATYPNSAIKDVISLSSDLKIAYHTSAVTNYSAPNPDNTIIKGDGLSVWTSYLGDSAKPYIDIMSPDIITAKKWEAANFPLIYQTSNIEFAGIKDTRLVNVINDPNGILGNFFSLGVDTMYSAWKKADSDFYLVIQAQTVTTFTVNGDGKIKVFKYIIQSTGASPPPSISPIVGSSSNQPNTALGNGYMGPGQTVSGQFAGGSAFGNWLMAENQFAWLSNYSVHGTFVSSWNGWPSADYNRTETVGPLGWTLIALRHGGSSINTGVSLNIAGVPLSNDLGTVYIKIRTMLGGANHARVTGGRSGGSGDY